jgi:hypothetical protein
MRLFQEEVDLVQRATKLSELAPTFVPEKLSCRACAVGPKESGAAVAVSQ